jgi:hypothetical protein
METMVMAGDDLTHSTLGDGPDEGEREAYEKGYNDYGIPGFIKSVYAPPVGYEQTYKEGWDTRRMEEDEELLREWTGVPLTAKTGEEVTAQSRPAVRGELTRRVQELAVKREMLLQQLPQLEEKHRIRDFTLAKLTVEGGLLAIDKEAQGLGFRFNPDSHTSCGGTIISDDKDHCLRCGKSGTLLANFDKLGNGRYCFREEWDERGDWDFS